MSERHNRSVFGSVAAALIFCVGHNSAMAQDLNAIKDCRSVENPDQRLQCFNDATAFLDEISSIASADFSKNGASNMDAADDEASFGSEELNREERSEEKKELRARLIGLRFTRNGKYIVSLDNGQVWRQINADSETLYLPEITSDGVPVVIKKGLLGSHFLRPESSKRPIRVERIE